MVIPDWCRGKRSSYDNAFVKGWYCCDTRSRETTEKRRNLMHEARPRTSQQSWHWDDFSCRTFNNRCSCRCLSPNLPRPKDETHGRSRRRHRSSRTARAQHLQLALFELKVLVVAKINDERQVVRSHLLCQEVEDLRCMHF